MRQTVFHVALFACSASVYLAAPMCPAAHAGGDPAKGQAIYQAKCTMCHGPQGKGDGPIGPGLKPPAADFTAGPSKTKPVDEMRRTIEEGKPNTAMVAWKSQLSAGEIDDVLTYVLTLRK
jgi:mono/diheme cytochrome c family protein